MNPAHDIPDEHVLDPDEADAFATGVGAVMHLAWRLGDISAPVSVELMLAGADELARFRSHPEQFIVFTSDDEALAAYDQACAKLLAIHPDEERSLFQYFLLTVAVVIVAHRAYQREEATHDREYDWRTGINTAVALAYRMGKPFGLTAAEMDRLLDERIAEIITRDALRAMETRAG